MYNDYVKVKSVYHSCATSYHNQKLNQELVQDRLSNASRMAQNLIDMYAMKIGYLKSRKSIYRLWWAITFQRKKKKLLVSYLNHINNSLKNMFDDATIVFDEAEFNMGYKNKVGF